ncbi:MULTISPECIES: hypothetical protein [unclassified Microbacterium]|uniref:hypothetical protein n=1 Tax=unclassified Microbacterium TaxID=2609290 RepID=UPI002006A232|nr:MULTISPECIES: hypothetical protein [unclassified Microbacterium]
MARGGDVKGLDLRRCNGEAGGVERIAVNADSTSHSPDLDRFVGGEQEGLPPAPEGAPDGAGTASPEERFVAPEGGRLEVDRDTVPDERMPESDGED